MTKPILTGDSKFDVIKVSDSKALQDADILGGIVCNVSNPDDVFTMAVDCAKFTDERKEEARKLLGMV